MKATYNKPITEITIIRLMDSVLDELPIGNYSRDIDYGDANTMVEFDAEDDALLPARESLWDD